MTSTQQDPRVTKRRVTMRSHQVIEEEDGTKKIITTEVVDYVRPDFLDAYVAAAAPNWQHIEVSDEPDAGPGGYNGATHVPAELDHPLAGQTFAAIEED